jgi:serine/threonine-protein kinase HipA
MEELVHVYADLNGTPRLCGRLWSRARKGQETASFEYDKEWLQFDGRFSLEPALSLGPGAFHTGPGKALFGAIGDSAPDRWGRMLMVRAERRAAKGEKRAARTLREIDYLLMVDDEARQGALRFAKTPGGPFLRADALGRIPPLVKLPQLLAAAEHFEGDTETAEDIRLLLAPGSSLGGARPKASVRDKNGELLIAKFPHKTDETNVVLWEALALRLAGKAGIDVPSWRVEKISRKHALVLERFDRAKELRVPFLSAMSMLGAKDNERHSYLEVVDAIRQHGARIEPDLEELWRRIVFYILISNTDDHLRNLGFLFVGSEGWGLAPAYDLNPVPVEIKPRELSTSITLEEGTASLSLAFEVASYFKLSAKRARAIVGEVGRAVRRWDQSAAELGISKQDREAMASAFEHDDLREAVKVAGGKSNS